MIDVRGEILFELHASDAPRRTIGTPLKNLHLYVTRKHVVQRLIVKSYRFREVAPNF